MRALIKVAAAIAIAALAPAALAADSTEFGGSPQRKHNLFDPSMSLPLGKIPGPHWQSYNGITYDVTGMSASQPAIIGELMYHLNGNQISCYNLSQITQGKTLGEARCGTYGPLWPDQDFVSASHPTFARINGRDVIFAGGPDRVAAVDLDAYQNTHQGKHVTTGGSVVSAPLVIRDLSGKPLDLVVFGDKSGKVWAVRGLAEAARTGNGAAIEHNHIEPEPNAVVSSSPAPARVSVCDASGRCSEYPGFVIGFDASNTVRGIAVRNPNGSGKPELRVAWTKQVASGVPASFAVDDQGYAYFSAKNATFYKMNPGNGQIVWSRPYSESGWFINNSPALSADKVFYTLRGKGWGGSQGNGRLVALDRSTGRIVWDRDLTVPLETRSGRCPTDWPGVSVRNGQCLMEIGNGNTAPFYWDSPGGGASGIVLVGTTGGAVAAYDADTGANRPFAEIGTMETFKYQPAYWMYVAALLEGPDQYAELFPLQMPAGWDQRSGASVEIAAANGFFAFGGNVKSQDGRRYGRLFAASIFPAMNYRLSNPRLELAKAPPEEKTVAAPELNFFTSSNPTGASSAFRTWYAPAGWEPVKLTMSMITLHGNTRLAVTYLNAAYSTIGYWECWYPDCPSSFSGTPPAGTKAIQVSAYDGWGGSHAGTAYATVTLRWADPNNPPPDQPPGKDLAGFIAAYDEPVFGRFTDRASLSWKWKGEPDSAYRPLKIDSAQGAGPEGFGNGWIDLRPNTSANVTFVPPNEGGTMVVKINPAEDYPPWEQTFADNTVEIVIPPDANLRAHGIRFSPPDGVHPNMDFSAWVKVTNEGRRKVTTKLNAWALGNSTQAVTVPGLEPGETREIGPFRFRMPYISAGDTIPVSFNVNPDRNRPQAEIRWDDNKVSAEYPAKFPNIVLETMRSTSTNFERGTPFCAEVRWSVKNILEQRQVYLDVKYGSPSAGGVQKKRVPVTVGGLVLSNYELVCGFSMAGKESVLTAEINPPDSTGWRETPETTYTDNTLSLVLGAYQPATPGGGVEWFLVHGDCFENPGLCPNVPKTGR